MDRSQLIAALTDALLSEPWAQTAALPPAAEQPRRYLRGLMNLRPPVPADPALLELQDQLLQMERAEKRITDAAQLPAVPLSPRLCLWRGDITALACEAIVNAANSALLGCFLPCHGCIDNAIHSAAGIQLRLACHTLMEAQGHEEPPGRAKLTPGFNLPARYVLHTVGPAVRQGAVTARHRGQLADCYRSCLTLAAEQGIASVAFCCISTGVYRFPREEAAELAVHTVLQTIAGLPGIARVIFNVFEEKDYDIYHRLLY